MPQMPLNDMLLAHLLKAQRKEITEHHVYLNLSRAFKKHSENSKMLAHLAEDEMSHYEFWKSYTGRDVPPSKVKIWWNAFIARFLGLTFGLKIMEVGEVEEQRFYGEIKKQIPEAGQVISDEIQHEMAHIDMINEEKLNYIGSIVLGLNDALVELSGALAGFTFAFQNTKLIAVTGLIMGVAASLSMAASKYLSSKNDEEEKPLKSSIYTGMAYVFTVILLVLPYFLLKNPFVSMIVMFGLAVFIIFIFNYYISVAKGYSFKARFWEMTILSFSVVLISFAAGVVVKKYIGVDI